MQKKCINTVNMIMYIHTEYYFIHYRTKCACFVRILTYLSIIY